MPSDRHYVKTYFFLVSVIYSYSNFTRLNIDKSVVVSINGKKARAIIDSGVTGNFISPTIVSSLGLIIELKEELY